MTIKNYFTGQGDREPDKTKLEPLPIIDPDKYRGGAGYRATKDLAAAVNVALTLGMPLLLTGEPGSGKSRLAHRIAWELHLNGPFEFPVKSDTRGTDLFYRFDTVGRFHASYTQNNGENNGADPRRFITFEALGKAILYAKPKAFLTDELRLPDQLEVVSRHPDEQNRSVVLIDEIDKAPRDVPNDILTEIESMSFRIPEFETADGREVSVGLGEDDHQYRPVVIITSNSEKALPEAFLRRCVFFHLSLPPFNVDKEHDKNISKDEISIEDVVASRLGDRYQETGKMEREAIDFFRYLRSDAVVLENRPSLAELLNWLDLILPEDGGETRPLKKLAEADLLPGISTTLLKEPEGQQQAPKLLQGWKEHRR